MARVLDQMRKEGLEAAKEIDPAKVAALHHRAQLAFNALYQALRDHLGDDIPQAALEAMANSINEKLAVQRYVVVDLDHVDVVRACSPSTQATAQAPGEG